MGKVDRLWNSVLPFAVLFWALGLILANSGSCPGARHHSTVVQCTCFAYNVHKACPYIAIVCSILNKDALPKSPFSI